MPTTGNQQPTKRPCFFVGADAAVMPDRQRKRRESKQSVHAVRYPVPARNRRPWGAVVAFARGDYGSRSRTSNRLEGLSRGGSHGLLGEKCNLESSRTCGSGAMRSRDRSPPCGLLRLEPTIARHQRGLT